MPALVEGYNKLVDRQAVVGRSLYLLLHWLFVGKRLGTLGSLLEANIPLSCSALPLTTKVGSSRPKNVSLSGLSAALPIRNSSVANMLLESTNR